MYKKMVWTITFAFSLIFTQAVLADEWGCGEGLKHMLATMKLDDTQQAKIKPVMDQLKSSMKDTWTQMRDLDTQIKQQANSDKMDVSILNGLVDQKTKLIGDAMKAKLAAQNQVMGILTPQQKIIIQTKLQALEQKMAAKFKSCHEQD